MTRPLMYPAYAHLVDVDVVFDRTVGSEPPSSTLLGDLADWLLADVGASGAEAPADGPGRRHLITRLLTVRAPRPFPPHVRVWLDWLWAVEAAERPAVGMNDLPESPDAWAMAGGTRLLVWRGDITTLAADAIVNAANADLVGCFRPGHACIDNAIHTAAGPRLREDCHRIITHQGHREPTGTAKITRAYYLPSRFILHTVGPIVPDGRPTPVQRAQLAACYTACLELATAMALRSVAFCAISTGVFGYPKAEAAAAALATVRAWLDEHPSSLDVVVFDVFSEEDRDAYRNQFLRA